MKSITSRQAKSIDLKASQILGIPALVMMENAGIRIADFILKLLRNRSNKSIAILCGKGNNAGDGLVVGRQLLCEGVDVDIFLLAPGYSLSLATRKNLEILRKLTKNLFQVRTKKDLEAINLSAYSVLVDAIFGIGLKGKVGGIMREAIQLINSSNSTIVSIDIPSGLDANNGHPLGAAVKADYTLTLIAPKKGLLVNQGPQFAGRLIVKHIGLPL